MCIWYEYKTFTVYFKILYKKYGNIYHIFLWDKYNNLCIIVIENKNPKTSYNRCLKCQKNLAFVGV